MLRVELAVARVQAARGLIPAEALAALESRARIDVERIAEIERTTDHDVIAFVSQVAETVGPEGRFLHLGLTSSDVVDTGPRPPAPGRRRAAPRRRGSAPRRPHRAGPARGRDRDDGSDPLGPRRADDPRASSSPAGRSSSTAADAVSRPPSTRSGPARSPGRSGRTATSIRRSRPRCSPRSGLHADPVSTQIVQRDRHAALLAADRHRRRVAGALRDRGPQPPAHRDRGAAGAVQGGPEGQLGDAPQAQPDPVRADRRPGPAPARLRPHRARGPAALARARHQPQQRRAGHPARTRRSCSTTCS